MIGRGTGRAGPPQREQKPRIDAGIQIDERGRPPISRHLEFGIRGAPERLQLEDGFRYVRLVFVPLRRLRRVGFRIGSRRSLEARNGSVRRRPMRSASRSGSAPISYGQEREQSDDRDRPKTTRSERANITGSSRIGPRPGHHPQVAHPIQQHQTNAPKEIMPRVQALADLGIRVERQHHHRTDIRSRCPGPPISPDRFPNSRVRGSRPAPTPW